MTALRAAILLLPFVACSAMAAESYPVRPIRLVVGYPPGGADDAHGRLVGEKLTELLGRQVIIDNRGGAAGLIGQDIAAKAAPDGYTLLIAGSPIVIKPIFYPKMPYDLMRDLTPVSQLVSTRFVLVVNASSPAKSVRDLIELARSKPGKLNFATSGTGASPHLCGELFKQLAKIDIIHVPYKGGGPAMVDLTAGHVDMSFASMGSSVGLIAAGKLRALAVTSAARSKTLPDVPTMAEGGVPDYEMTSWYALFAPAATSRDIVSQLNAAVVKSMATPEVQERLFRLGSEPASSTPEAMTQRLRNDSAKLMRVAKAAGLKTD